MAFGGDYVIRFFGKFIGCPNDADLAVCLGISLVVR